MSTFPVLLRLRHSPDSLQAAKGKVTVQNKQEVMVTQLSHPPFYFGRDLVRHQIGEESVNRKSKVKMTGGGTGGRGGPGTGHR